MTEDRRPPGSREPDSISDYDEHLYTQPDYGYRSDRSDPYRDAGYYADRGDGHRSEYRQESDFGYEPEYDSYGRHDESGPRAMPTAVGVPRLSRGDARRIREAARRKRRGRIIGVLAGAVLLGGIGAAAIAVYDQLSGGSSADYAGPGGPEVVVEVHAGDTAEQIATAMAAKDVVASESAFYKAALRNDSMSAVQPGFYAVATRIPASEAVSTLVSPSSRVGAIVISEGRQLHDTRDVQTGAVKKGIYTLISEASCLGPVGAQKCITYDELDKAGSGSNLAALGVPDWASARVANVPDRDRQLEGLIAAGSWDFDPTDPPVEILRHLVSSSAENYEATGIKTAGANVGLDPYQMLIVASLVEREALPADFDKVARVVLNRLAVDQPLQFDSTVNYSLDETEVATTDADRARVTPWNTYAMSGLPATPIASPSINALRAVENPAPGDYLYFVTIDKKGSTLFTRSYDEHLANIELARKSGILDSGR
ncbi:endolytic transglycosylase MltG [Rhodococcus sp. ABRD24]|uniref:endolytic transglycosylase MltG n=1 Tax=Rhodococcus sp. ABRD24 TaxID=2507582 RepID=UPI001F613CB8|nr:endolytic transglycosylase MltG [Rhodococcus sp. ABRD24]